MNPEQIENTLLKTLGENYNTYTYLLAVSGGRDSMTLLQIFNSLHLNFVVAHVNYQLRDEDSDSDEALVMAYCKRNSIAIEILKSDTKNYCRKHRLGTQEAARNIRYDWFAKLKIKYQAAYIVTAHHQNDVIETFFINLSRGSGVKGLKSINYLHEDKLRPLIQYNRSEITDYAKNHNIPYRDDRSNETNDYLRNTIRNQVLPFVNSKINDFEKGVSKSISFLKMDATYLYEQLEKESKQVLTQKNNTIVIRNYSKLSKRLLFHLLQKFGFNYTQLNNIIENSNSGNVFHNSSYQLTLNRDDINIDRKDCNKEELRVKIDKYGKYEIEGLTLTITSLPKPKNLHSEPSTAYFSPSKLKFPITIRNWNEGDSFQPFGMKGRKKISDFFIDKKIGVSEKSKIKILESNGEIAWIIGFRTSEHFKVDTNCHEVIEIVTK